MTAPTAEIVTIPFRDDEILAANIDGKPFVVLRPAFESIGLDADQQIRRLKRQHWATTVATTVVASDGKPREQIACDVRTFLMMLATIPASRVSDNARPKLEDYQKRVAEVIEEYWTKGGAVNPHATPEQLGDLDTRVQRRLAELALADREDEVRYNRTSRRLDLINKATHLDPQYRGNLSKHALAEIDGKVPDISPEEQLLTVEGYLNEKGVSRADQASIRSQFGKKLKAAYVLEHGENPGEVVGVIDGRERNVKAYYGRHRHLFDQVFHAGYAHLVPAMLPGVAA